MKRIVAFEQLEYAMGSLFVEVICPNCGRMLKSLVPDAEIILIFGCTICADIDPSMLFLFDKTPALSTDKVPIQTEEIEEIV